jgi:hypothetical protein
MEHFKVLKETLEQKKLDNYLILYIKEKLNHLRIEFNQGFVMSLNY